ncbi:MAG TPA: divalent metal cation transporter, partial [Terriglobales bacterium]|nr:divalent metal cation transporter [Terriglobales bacterium]
MAKSALNSVLGTIAKRPRRRVPWRIARFRLLAFFAIIGPGFITANVDNDANGIVTYSQAGAQFGYQLLWTMIPVTIALIVVQEIAARMGAVTGKGLSDLIREEFGLRITFFMMLAILVINFGNILGEFAGIAASLELFGLSRYYTVPVCAAIVWLIVVKGQYKSVEKIFLVASFIYITYIFAGIIALHSASHGTAASEWIKAVISTVKPPGKELFRHDYLFMTITVIGTT